jgi:hypothetical protein
MQDKIGDTEYVGKTQGQPRYAGRSRRYKIDREETAGQSRRYRIDRVETGTCQICRTERDIYRIDR